MFDIEHSREGSSAAPPSWEATAAFIIQLMIISVSRVQNCAGAPLGLGACPMSALLNSHQCACRRQSAPAKASLRKGHLLGANVRLLKPHGLARTTTAAFMDSKPNPATRPLPPSPT